MNGVSCWASIGGLLIPPNKFIQKILQSYPEMLLPFLALPRGISSHLIIQNVWPHYRLAYWMQLLCFLELHLSVSCHCMFLLLPVYKNNERSPHTLTHKQTNKPTIIYIDRAFTIENVYIKHRCSYLHINIVNIQRVHIITVYLGRHHSSAYKLARQDH